jgi:Uma2 family endonuclease
MAHSVEQIWGAWEQAPNRIRWTRSQCKDLGRLGLLPGHYELIDGELLSTAGQSPSHRIAVILLRDWLISLYGGPQVQVQSTIDVGGRDPEHNEPEPDVAVTEQPATAYFDRHPGPADLVLVAEVSDSTLAFDRGNKAALYALSGVREYWVLDLKGRRLLVLRQPAGEYYREITAYSAQEHAATLARPEVWIRVGELLPPVR